MPKNIIHITESHLRGLITKSIKRSLPNVLNEIKQEISKEEVKQSLAHFLGEEIACNISINISQFKGSIQIIQARYNRNDYINFVKYGKLLFNEWFNFFVVYETDNGSIIRVKNYKGVNLISPDFNYLLPKFCHDITDVDTRGNIFVVCPDNEQAVTFIDNEGNVLSNERLDKWDWGFVDNHQQYIYVKRIEDKLYNILGFKEKRFMFNDWLKEIVYDEDWDNILYIKSPKTNRWNMATFEGDIYFKTWFNLINIFTENCAIVKLNKKYNVIKLDGTFVSNIWFDKCVYNCQHKTFWGFYNNSIFVKIDEDGNIIKEDSLSKFDAESDPDKEGTNLSVEDAWSESSVEISESITKKNPLLLKEVNYTDTQQEELKQQVYKSYAPNVTKKFFTNFQWAKKCIIFGKPVIKVCFKLIFEDWDNYICNFVSNGQLLFDEWFFCVEKCCEDNFLVVKTIKQNKMKTNIIDKNFNYLFPEFTNDSNIIPVKDTDYVIVRKDNLYNFLNKNGLVSDIWFKDYWWCYGDYYDYSRYVVIARPEDDLENILSLETGKLLFDEWLGAIIPYESGYLTIRKSTTNKWNIVLANDGYRVLSKVWFDSEPEECYNYFIVEVENRYNLIKNDGTFHLKEWANDYNDQYLNRYDEIAFFYYKQNKRIIVNKNTGEINEIHG